MQNVEVSNWVYSTWGSHQPTGANPKKEQTRKVAYDNGSIRAPRDEH